MNEKFYSLPETKQQSIINAGFQIFSQNSYKKAPMQEIADQAGISQSLLFQCYEPDDLFEMMERGMRAKIKLMEKYPSLTSFAIKAFYEKDLQIAASIRQSYDYYFSLKAQNALAKLNPDDFIEDLDLKMMYREMYLASEGYLWEIIHWNDTFNAEILEKDFNRMLAFWKSIYLRKEG